MQPVRISRSSTRCITKEILKQNLRISHNTEDGLMDLWIEAAEQYVEIRLNRSIMRQGYRLTTDYIRGTVALPRPGVDVDSVVTKIDVFDGDLVTSPTISQLLKSQIGMLPAVTIPSILRDRAGRIQIEYDAGAQNVSDVPAAIRQAVLLLASNWYRSREAVPTDLRARAPSTPLPFGADALVAGYRIPNINVEPEMLAADTRCF